MKKIFLGFIVFTSIAINTNANDSTCKIYADQMNKEFKILSFKAKNHMDIPNYELNMFKNNIASVYGECDENTKYQKSMKSLILPMQDAICGFSVMILGDHMRSIGKKMGNGIEVSQYEVDTIRSIVANAEINCGGNTKAQKEGKEHVKKSKALINSTFK